MPFKKGKSGNPTGRRKEKQFFDALNMEVAASEGRALRSIAKKLLDEAQQGNMQAIKEVADRFDGKADQSVHNTHEDVTDLGQLTLIELAARADEILQGAQLGDSVEEEQSAKPAKVRTLN